MHVKDVELKRECCIYENTVEVSCHILFLSKGGCTHQLCTHQYARQLMKTIIYTCIHPPRNIVSYRFHMYTDLWCAYALHLSCMPTWSDFVVWDKDLLLLWELYTSSVLVAIVGLTRWALIGRHFHHYSACIGLFVPVWTVVSLSTAHFMRHTVSLIYIIDVWGISARKYIVLRPVLIHLEEYSGPSCIQYSNNYST